QGDKVDAFDLCVGGRFGENPEFVRPLYDKVPAPIIHRQIESVVQAYMDNRVNPDTDDDPETFRDFIDRIELTQLREWSKIPEWTPPPPKVRRTAPAYAPAADPLAPQGSGDDVPGQV
ncbi:MAG TPA: hypothetical protein VGB55_05375, partial [Tepidisphaeraceae bacterium]